MATTTTDVVMNEIGNTLHKIHIHLQNLAPINTKYKSLDRGKLVDYIYVNGDRVSGNTNNLRNSVKAQLVQESKFGFIHSVGVSSSSVPYYSKAVLESELLVAYHRKRTEYGSLRYSTSIEYLKPNRNYLYYMKGEAFVAQEIRRWNNREYIVSDDISKYEDKLHEGMPF